MTPVVIMPMTMLPVGPGDSSSGRSYRRTTPPANGSPDDRAGCGASRRLCDSVSRKHRCRKAKQEQ
jgi:hypothetical protein